jgi:hypothetical protein
MKSLCLWIPRVALLSMLSIDIAPAWAGVPAPAPLVGVTGPFGIVAAAIACGGYLLFKRYNNRQE